MTNKINKESFSKEIDNIKGVKLYTCIAKIYEFSHVNLIK